MLASLKSLDGVKHTLHSREQVLMRLLIVYHVGALSKTVRLLFYRSNMLSTIHSIFRPKYLRIGENIEYSAAMNRNRTTPTTIEIS